MAPENRVLLCKAMSAQGAVNSKALDASISRCGRGLRKPDSSGADSGRVMCSDESRRDWNYFLKPCRTLGEIAMNPSKIVESIVKGFVKA